MGGDKFVKKIYFLKLLVSMLQEPYMMISPRTFILRYLDIPTMTDPRARGIFWFRQMQI